MMTRKRDLVAENKRILLGGLLAHLGSNRSGYRGNASIACEELVAEFTRRARFVTGPPPGHPQLPGLETPMEIKAGDTIRHSSVPAGVMDVMVLAITPCEGHDHDAYLIKDPETGEPDTVCSREFVRVES